MSEHSHDEARANLSDLIDRALAGEGVIITRGGRPVAALSPIHDPGPGRPVTAADMDWLAAHRVPTRAPSEDAGSLLSRLRDEEW